VKTLDAKLARIRDGKYTPRDFIIADAKDGDMGGGCTVPGPRRDGRGMKSKPDYLAAMTEMTQSGLVDIMLTSLSSAEILDQAGLFKDSKVTLAVRLNDTTDIWGMRGSTYKSAPQRPYRTAQLAATARIADLGLYSVTFSNDVALDLATMEAYAAFREELAQTKVRHFLEVFNSALDIGLKGATMGEYANDCIIKTLAGVTSSQQPLFLKQQFNGTAAVSELAAYDPTRLIVGILGGGRGTTRDTFELAAQAERAGARVALFGRKINFAESPLDLVRHMRLVVEGELTGADAVKSYHDVLAKKKIKPDRDLTADQVITDPMLEA
jgi:hypothetical protein